MNKESLIEDLVFQDLRHMQLIYGLESIGLIEEGFHNLELSDSIAELMGMRGEESIDRFYQVYWGHIEKCRELEMTYSRGLVHSLLRIGEYDKPEFISIFC